MPQTIVQLTALGKSYASGSAETEILRDIDLTIHPGEYVAIAGPSGCGKSTLLSVLGLLDAPSAGEYRLNGIDVAHLGGDERARIRNRQIGFVFQAFNLIGDLTVRENVQLPLVYRGVEPAEREERAGAALERVQMLDFAGQYPSYLSGGQQQRVAVARAIVGNPLVLLADEPTGNLDSRSAAVVMELISDLHAGGATVILVTHDPAYAAQAGRTLHMLDGCLQPGEPPPASGSAAQ